LGAEAEFNAVANTIYVILKAIFTRLILTKRHRKIRKLNTTQKQATQNTAKQNYPGSVAFYDIRPGNEIGILYSAHEPTMGAETDHLLHDQFIIAQDNKAVSETVFTIKKQFTNQNMSSAFSCTSFCTFSSQISRQGTYIGD